MKEVVMKEVVLLPVFLGVTWLLVKNLRLDEKKVTMSKGKLHDAILGMACYFSILVFSIMICCLLKSGVKIFGNEIDKSIVQYFYNLVLIVIPLSFVLFGKEKIDSVGIPTKNFAKSIFYGFLFSIIILLIGVLYNLLYSIYLGNSLMNLEIIRNIVFQNIAEPKLVPILILVGISEEVAYRGYIQTKMVSSIGDFWGIIVVAVLFAMSHIPAIILRLNMDFYGAFIAAAYLIPTCIVLGYIFHKTKNLIIVSIIHICIDVTRLI